MIIVDTNVVSEAIRNGREPALVAWLDAQIAETLYFTATSLAELQFGIEVLPDGKRKVGLNADVNALLASIFGSRILAFDKEAAIAYGALVASARSTGHSISVADGQMAAIATVRGFSVATRDVTPFKALGITVLNPWTA